MKDNNWYNLHDAQWYLNHFNSGLLYVGREDNEEQWLGSDKSWKHLTWLSDGLTLEELQNSL